MYIITSTLVASPQRTIVPDEEGDLRDELQIPRDQVVSVAIMAVMLGLWA